MAARIRHLANAPIVEALIDLKVQAREDATASMFESVRGRLASAYPKVKTLQTFATHVGVQQGQLVAGPASQGEAGVLCFTEDEKTVVQFRVDGFTFNKLQPYSSWNDIYPETLRLWRLYQEVARPRQVTRAAARYINRLALPSADYGKYLSALPQLPPELPQEARSFLTRVTLYDSHRATSAILTQAFESPVEAPSVGVLLDIDAFKDLEITPSDSELDSLFESLHSLKNEIFFGSITEETARIYE
jgi:uncharacterized protein (TIGR04255 family)